MAKCNNKVTQTIESGYNVKEIKVPCGSTSIYGERLMCGNCQNDKNLTALLEIQDENTKIDNAWSNSACWGDS
tara:strand:- start:234 stop:452 length:219 start_codon:yes stop_codon:yes gene_type:complete